MLSTWSSSYPYLRRGYPFVNDGIGSGSDRNGAIGPGCADEGPQSTALPLVGVTSGHPSRAIGPWEPWCVTSTMKVSTSPWLEETSCRPSRSAWATVGGPRSLGAILWCAAATGLRCWCSVLL